MDNQYSTKTGHNNKALSLLIPALCLLAFLSTGNAWAATIEDVDSKANAANSKADGNNGRIQALEAEDVILHQRIDTIQLTPGATGPQGIQGPAGANGLDGATGPAGTNGLDGATGAPGYNGTDGSNGTNGINCWDLNGNGVNDPSEDVNNDGTFNTLDCAGNLDLSGILERLSYLEARLQNTDFDNDGFTPAAGDCNDSDAAISPNAVEIADNNIDENCDGQIVQTVNENLPIKTLGISVFIDQAAIDKYGVNWKTIIANKIASASSPYETQFNLSFRVDLIELVTTNFQIDITTSNEILDEVRILRENSTNSIVINSDLSILFTGFSDALQISAGMAWQGTVCGAYQYQLSYISVSYLDIPNIAHQIGHHLGLNHLDTGNTGYIMSIPLSPTTTLAFSQQNIDTLSSILSNLTCLDN